jgi:hypothetical protein
VRRFESKRLGRSKLLQGVHPEELSLEGQLDPDLVARLYDQLRRTEAYVYRVRRTSDPLASDLVRKWRRKLRSIRGLLLRIPTAGTELEAFGVFSLKMGSRRHQGFQGLGLLAETIDDGAGSELWKRKLKHRPRQDLRESAKVGFLREKRDNLSRVL